MLMFKLYTVLLGLSPKRRRILSPCTIVHRGKYLFHNVYFPYTQYTCVVKKNKKVAEAYSRGRGGGGGRWNILVNPFPRLWTMGKKEIEKGIMEKGKNRNKCDIIYNIFFTFYTRDKIPDPKPPNKSSPKGESGLINVVNKNTCAP